LPSCSLSVTSVICHCSHWSSG